MKTKTPQQKPTLEKLAQASGISLATLKRYKTAGVDVTDPEAVKAHALSQTRQPSALANPAERAAKVRRIELQCDHLAHELSVKRGEMVPKSEVMRDTMAMSMRLSQLVRNLEREAPNWAGFPPHILNEKARAFVDSLMVQMSEWAKGVCPAFPDRNQPIAQEDVEQNARLMALWRPPAHIVEGRMREYYSPKPIQEAPSPSGDTPPL